MNLTELSIRRRVTVSMFMVAVLLFGSVALSRLKVNLLPELTFPSLTVRTDFRGAAPAEVEHLISKPIEESLGIVKNVRLVRSTSRTGQSDVILEFAWGTDMDKATLEVREQLDLVNLPREVQRPVILRFDPSLDPVIRLGLTMAQRSVDVASASDADQSSQLTALRRFADEQIKKELESVLGVAAVKVSGGFEEEIQVHVDPEKLARMKIPIEQVSNVLSRENINMSGGQLEEGRQQYLVRTVNQFRNLEDIGEVVIGAAGTTPVYLKDVATVEMGHREREAVTRLNGDEAIELAIYKEGDANTVAVAKALESRMERVKRNMPPGMVLTSVYDQSTFINEAVRNVVNAGMVGGLLAIAILYFFLRTFRSTLIIAITIPMSIVATFNLMYGANVTLNIMSLGGLALGIGLLVDNAIVVLENIARYRERGASLRESALKGAGEVSMAVMASTLTTVAVFLPLVFVDGIAGQLFRDQALTVTFSLLASLAVALTLIPMLASLGKDEQEILVDGDSTEPGKTVRYPGAIMKLFVKLFQGIGYVVSWMLKPFVRLFDGLYNYLLGVYTATLRSALNYKGIVVATAVAITLATFMLVPSLGLELIPQMNQGEFKVEFNMPAGTPLEQTDENLRRVQRVATTSDRVNVTFAVAGTGNRMDANTEEGGEQRGEMTVQLKPGNTMMDEEAEMNRLREEMNRIPGASYKFSRPTFFSFKTPVEIEISGYDLDALGLVSRDIVRRMESDGMFTDVRTSMEMGSPEVQIVFDRQKAAALGLTPNQISDRIVRSVRGDVATRFSRNDRKIDVLVRTPDDARSSVESIRNLIVNPDSERPVTLSAVADVRIENGPAEIRRSGQERVAIVTANLAAGDLGLAAQRIESILAEAPRPAGIVPRLAGQNKEMADSFASLQFALILAVFLVYLVMASQFESLLHPFVILFSIPMAAVGAILALWITGTTVSIVVFIGLIMLAGIVVNNAIILIDKINQLRATGMEKVAATIEAGSNRLRPILMTTLTTVLGLLPLAIGLGEGAEMRAPMAITVIGGLIVSTMLTLLVIPSVYLLLDRKKYNVASEVTL